MVLIQDGYSVETFLWHDYETFGANPKVDRVAQFAAVRTDSEFNVIGEAIQFYCKVSDDYLPQPQACLITGITPQVANSEGYSEPHFARLILDEMLIPSTCSCGYNSIRFDDEVSRHLFYRNFHDAYAREWKNGNSRWDIIDLLRFVYAVRPNSINWPSREDGVVSFRLEELTKVNGIAHEAAHEALSDVYATIALAKLVKERCSDLFGDALALRDKHNVRAIINSGSLKPFFHVSSKYPANLGCCSVVVALIEHPVNKNGVVVYDLRYDPAELIELTVDQIKAKLFVKTEDLAPGESRLALKVIHINKCPVVAPISITTTIPPQHLSSHGLIGDELRKNLAKLRSAPGFVEKLTQVYSELVEENGNNISDPELMLYTGGFFSHHDKVLMERVVGLHESEITSFEPVFADSRLAELYFRYKARNYPHSLTEDEHEKWESFRADHLTNGSPELLSLNQYSAEIRKLAELNQDDARVQSILTDLMLYAESIIPYD